MVSSLYVWDIDRRVLSQNRKRKGFAGFDRTRDHQGLLFDTFDAKPIGPFFGVDGHFFKTGFHKQGFKFGFA